jgi:hypothetical protein
VGKKDFITGWDGIRISGGNKESQYPGKHNGMNQGLEMRMSKHIQGMFNDSF